VPVIERRDQADVLAAQHAVPEDVPAHIPDTRDGATRFADIEPDFAEATLDTVPRSARGDTHRFVVVAHRTTGGEGVSEPEVVFGSHLVGDIGEGGRALVGGHHQIRIVTVVAHHTARWADLILRAVDIVGEVEQAADERAISGGTGGLPRAAIGVGIPGRYRGPAEYESTLGAGRHDDRVLHRLGLHQPEDLGAEILAPI
jgi:hypothetical protein